MSQSFFGRAPQNVEQFNKSVGYNVSAKYTPVNTVDLVRGFEANGFSVASLSKARVQKAEKQGFQKHLIRLRRPDLQTRAVGDLFPEIVVVNSYDGSSAFKIMLGIFRLVCANGMVTGSMFQTQRVRHVGDAVSQVLVASEVVAAQLPKLNAIVDVWAKTVLTVEQQRALGAQAQALVLPDGAIQMGRQSETILRPLRSADTAQDLWTVFNRVQERVLRGGLSYSTVATDGRVQNHSTRSVKSIDRNVELNQKLWDIAAQFAA